MVISPDNVLPVNYFIATFPGATGLIYKDSDSNTFISYAIQHIPVDRLKEVLEKMEKFKKWIQTLASPKTDNSVVPFIYLAWGKVIPLKELAYGKENLPAPNGQR